MTTKTFKVSEVIEAVRKNGYEQITGSLIKASGAKFIGACAMGQAALNLGVNPWNLEEAGYSVEIKMGENDLDIKPDTSVALTGFIEYLNDGKRLTCEQIADEAEKAYKDYLDVEIQFEDMLFLPSDYGVPN